jgi:hypothetical protein
MALEEGLLVACQVLSNMEADGPLSIAVVVDDKLVIPIAGNINAIGRAVESSDLGESQRRAELN